MKKSLALLLALLLCVSLSPAALGAETLSAVTAAASAWALEMLMAISLSVVFCITLASA